MNEKHRLIVLTGASRGLGRALTRWFIAHGHRVAAIARSATAMEELRRNYGAPHQFDAVDVTDLLAVQAWASRVQRTLGVPDLLVNNAAQINRNSPLWEVPPDEFSDVIDANIKGVFHVCVAFLPAMIAEGRGVVANFSSTWGRTTAAEVAPYCATKWAVEGLTQALAQELPAPLAAVPVNPGIIDTDMLRSCFGEHAARFDTPEGWVEQAGPFLLRLGRQHNGQPVSIS